MSNKPTKTSNSTKYNLSDPSTYSIREGGYYGDNQDSGGSYIPPMLIEPLQDLADTFEKYRNEPEFLKELEYYQINFVGRPSPLIFAKNLSEKLGGAKIYLKNEGANLTGAHKINHCLLPKLKD